MKHSTADKLMVISWKEMPKLDTSVNAPLIYILPVVLKRRENPPFKTNPMDII